MNSCLGLSSSFWDSPFYWGIATRISLFVMGLVYVSLTFGLILIGQDGGIAWLAAHTIMIAYALTLVRYNRFGIMKKL